ncbi:two component transcriptional regulator, winged helix family [Nannocystis exedens]|uniref:Two component transcriptional regulator, winged helix family n=1 Tax=Nannocystis exedens TaxID=54 RepID=A0A1I1Z6E0_9BACT|nr:response regulator transcription factor [Nannocystis exedens]PCC75133.1 DNA-binding response regulator [Nannocystis exedens]SFE27356.1 two component transcriptional regulator, winged helix family [Nannocystis exedens]
MSGLILIVEDERDLVATLEYALEREGFRTRSAYTGRQALEIAVTEPAPDLVLLDLMLPDMSGTQVCQQLRAGERTRAMPVIMMTAKAEEVDRVVGFEVGADDYVVKPFSLRELMLRIRAVLRRKAPAETTLAPTPYGRLRVDMDGHRVWVDEGEVTLTALEFRLLTTLIARRGRVQTRDALLADVWGVQPGLTTRTVDTHVRRLRKKLGDIADYVQTLRGVGYRFTTDLRAAEDDEP